MAGLIPAEELRRLQDRMNKLMEDLGLADLESRYLEEMDRMQKRIGDLMEDIEKTDGQKSVMKPLADVRETDEEVIVSMDLPGVDKQNVDITILGDELRVAGEIKTDEEATEKDYYKRERIYRKFERRISLPVAVKMDEARASLEKGVLQVTLPKERVTTRKRINID